MNNEALFAKTPPTKLFFKAAIPGAIGMLASALFQLLEGIFVGQYLGDTAFSALNLAMPFVIINFALADLIGAGSSVPISIRLGQKRGEEANQIFTCACLLILGSGVVFGGLMHALSPALIRWMGAEGECAALAVQYLQVYALCSPVTTIIFAVDNYLRICGKIRYSMLLNIFMSLFIAGAQYLLLGPLNCGIWGASLATCLGMFLSALIAFFPFFFGKAELRFARPRLSLSILKKIVACGSPNFLNNIAGRITSIMMNAILVRLGGETAVSVYGILMFAEGFIQPLLYGMCDSLQPAVGYNWGAQKFSRVRAIEKCCFVAAAVVSLLSVFAIAFFPEQITRLFVANPSNDILNMSIGALRLFSLTYVTRWFSFATQSYMLAIEKPLPASLISLSTALLFPVVLVGALWPLGLTGIWMNFAGTSLLAAILSAVILKKLWHELKKPDAEKTVAPEGNS